MSATLTFYSTPWSSVTAILGSGQKRFLGEILKGPGKEILEDLEPDDDEAQEFEDALERLIDGRWAREKADDISVLANLPECLAFSAILQFVGKLVGTLDHTLKSEKLFREQFLNGAAQQALKAPFSLEVLLSRPLLGFESDEFPYWGGLSCDELSRLGGPLQSDAPEYPESADIETWIGQLWDVLGSAAALERDLVTIYS
jgi:hypothetical protein